jgi:hypothetical protein
MNTMTPLLYFYSIFSPGHGNLCRSWIVPLFSYPVAYALEKNTEEESVIKINLTKQN